MPPLHLIRKHDIGYRFCPRLADIGGTRFWRIDPQADYGKLNIVSQHRCRAALYDRNRLGLLSRVSGQLVQMSLY